ncbi:Kynureninase [Pseudoalteromonas sp. THAF3]|uniref:aminotransferase class V-fold PLP-dependent enzyme n=1 Tax=Pseudoalteromonas sp. THAF3 TaxID=2587843 RepID=UPI001268BC91|nr:aminotransferase class V-fold PLP-dependent enzyme [Pseudoalteromonas sp. THAF3]QFU06277.1 Kynureninase [Pseudoalteromonas sp. THAF3]
MKDTFALPQGPYLLSHSVGRPLTTAQHAFNEAFFAPWQQGQQEPWSQWLQAIEQFTQALARLFNSSAGQFCPQVNLSSALTKLLMAHPRLTRGGCKVLLSEQDFPSMGFVLQKALPEDCQLRFIPAHEDVSDAQVWQHYLDTEVDLVFVSQVYSNSGQQAPVAHICEYAKKRGVLSLIDVAQGAGVIPLDLTAVEPGFMIGSSVKWLCGGPGAAYLWVSEQQLAHCQPKDVGWFSHSNPFEFDIHHFDYHPSALRFWGGTPNIAPYVLAAHSISWFNEYGIDKVRNHNLAMQQLLWSHLQQWIVSPKEPEKRSGTLIVHGGRHQRALLAELSKACISVDERRLGIRISPHIYNDEQDIAALLSVASRVLGD